MLAKQQARDNRLINLSKNRKKLTKTAIKGKKFNFRHFCHFQQPKNASNPQNCNHLLYKNCSSNRGLFNTHSRQ